MPIDNNAIRKKFNIFGLILAVEEIHALNVQDKEITDLENNLNRLYQQIKTFAINNDSIYKQDISPHRTLYIITKDKNVIVFIYDSKKEEITQNVTYKELLRIEWNDAHIIERLYNKSVNLTKKEENVITEACNKVHINSQPLSNGPPYKQYPNDNFEIEI